MVIRRILFGHWRAISEVILALVAIVSLGLALRTEFHQRTPDLTYTVVSQTDVLDVRQPVSGLAVMFNGINLQDANLNLRILRFRIANEGDATIVQGAYDRDDVWGIQFTGGEIIEARLVDASTPYLTSNVQPSIAGVSTVQFNKVIMEPGGTFTIEALVLHSKNVGLSFAPVGKIAGINEPRMQVATASQAQRGILEEVFYGSPAIHLARASIYAIIFIALAIITMVIVINIDEVRGRGARKRRAQVVETVSRRAKDLWTAQSERAAAFYVDYGYMAISKAQGVIINDSMRREYLASYREVEKGEGDLLDTMSRDRAMAEWAMSNRQRFEQAILVRNMINSGFLIQNAGDNVTVDENAAPGVNDFLSLLISYGDQIVQ